MTVEEFNIKYKDYLEEGHYGLDINNQEVIKYLDNIFIDLIKIPGFKYTQIKIKFSSIRFYSTIGYNLADTIEYMLETILKGI